jgi:hypothetical protein
VHSNAPSPTGNPTPDFDLGRGPLARALAQPSLRICVRFRTVKPLASQMAWTRYAAKAESEASLNPRAGLGYISYMDALDRHRVLELRQEIASLQRESESYRWQARHTASEAHRNELRRLRLLAIQEELLRLNEHQQRIQ